ncbi:MAG: acyltransferase [Actinobacteria bacterium]|nr:acyltransferase [Actinomycetota bacterium]
MYEFPGWVALVPVLGAGLALSAGSNTKGGPQLVLGLAPMQWVGARSYSLYLWHWPALIIAASNKGESLSAGDRWKLLILVVLVAEIGFHLVENPIRRSTKLQHERRLSFALGGALVVSGVIASLWYANHWPVLPMVLSAPHRR